MVKAECIWCGSPSKVGPQGMFYIHEKCLFEVDDMKDKFEFAKKYAVGQMPRTLANGDKQGYATFEKFLAACDDFNRRWENTTNLIKQLKNSQCFVTDSTPEAKK